METIAILQDPRLSVDDRGLVALRFTSALEGLSALQMIYLELEGGGGKVMNHQGLRELNALIRAAGSFDKLEGLPIIVDKEPGTMTYKRPANI